MPRLLTLLALLTTALVPYVAGAPFAHAEGPDETQAAENHIYQCLQTAETVSVLFTMDYSRSLAEPDMDPNGIRFDALEVAIEGLAQLTRPDGQPLNVEVAVSGFAVDYKHADTVAPWRLITGDDREAAVSDTLSKARKQLQPTGTGTNFEKALDGAYEDFATNQRVSDCRILYWFTDGQFTTSGSKDIDDAAKSPDPAAATAEAKAVIDEARSRICQPGTGVVDKLRNAGVVVFGLQLGKVADDLRRMSVGSYVDRSCGTFPIPQGQAPGGYLNAEHADELVWIFKPMHDADPGCTPTGTQAGMIDPGIRSVTVRVPRVDVQIPPPASESLTLLLPGERKLDVSVPGSQALDGFDVISQHDPGHVAATVTLADSAAAGRWDVKTPFAHRDASFCVSPGLSLVQTPNSDRPIAGEESSLLVSAVYANGSPADLSVFKQVTAEATALDGQGKEIPSAADVENGVIQVSLSPGSDVARVTVSVKLHLTTASGLALNPISAEIVTPTRSENFPSIEPYDRLRLGTISQTGTGSADLTLIGSPRGATQVCLGEPQPVRGPVSEEQHKLSYESGCVDLEADEHRTVSVSFTPSQAAIGSGDSSIAVTFRSTATQDQDTSEQSLDLTVSWQQTIPVDAGRLTLLTAISVLGSVLILWAALWLATYLTTRFNTRNLRMGSSVALISSGGLLTDDPAEAGYGIGSHGSGSTPKPRFGTLKPAGRTNPRNIATARPPSRLVNGTEVRVAAGASPLTLVAKTPLFPWQQPRFNAQVTEGYLLSATGSAGLYDEGRTAPINPGLGLQIVFVANQLHVRDASDATALPALIYLFCTDKDVHDADIDDAVRAQSFAGMLNKWREVARKTPSVNSTPKAQHSGSVPARKPRRKPWR